MKRSLIALVLAVTAVVATGALVPATSQPPEQRTSLTWFDPRKTDFEKGMNLGGKGFAGDMAVIKDSLFDPETCEKAGTLLLRFQGIKAIGENDGFFMAEGQVLLPDGKVAIALAGRFTELDAETGAMGAVTGGTGAYRDVTGDFNVVEDQQMCDKRGSLISASLVLE